MAYNNRFPGGGGNFNNQQQPNPAGRMPFNPQLGPYSHGSAQGMTPGMYGYMQPQPAPQQYPGGFVQGYAAEGHIQPNPQMQQAFQHQQQQKMLQQQQKLAEANQKMQVEARKKQEFEAQQRKLQAFTRTGSRKTAPGDLSHLIGSLAQRNAVTSAGKQQVPVSSIFSRPGGSYSSHHTSAHPGQKFQPHGSQSSQVAMQHQHPQPGLEDFGDFKENSTPSDDVFSDFQEATFPQFTAPAGAPPQGGSWPSTAASVPSSYPHSAPPWNNTLMVHGGAQFRHDSGDPGGHNGTWSGAPMGSGPSVMAPTESALAMGQRLRTNSGAQFRQDSGVPAHNGTWSGAPMGSGPSVMAPTESALAMGQRLRTDSMSSTSSGTSVGMPPQGIAMPNQYDRYTAQMLHPGASPGPVMMPGILPSMPPGPEQTMAALTNEEPIDEVKELTPKDVYGINIPHWCEKGASQLPCVYKDVAELASTTDGAVNTGILYPILLASGLSRDILGKIWNEVNRETPGELNQLELKMMLGLLALGQTGIKHERLTLEKLATCQTAPLPSFPEDALKKKGRGWSFDEGNEKDTQDLTSLTIESSNIQQQGQQVTNAGDVSYDPNDKYGVFRAGPQSSGDQIGGVQGWGSMDPSTSQIMTRGTLSTSGDQIGGGQGWPSIGPSTNQILTQSAPSDHEFGEFQGDSKSEFSEFQGSTDSDFGDFRGTSNSSGFQSSTVPSMNSGLDSTQKSTPKSGTWLTMSSAGSTTSTVSTGLQSLACSSSLATSSSRLMTRPQSTNTSSLLTSISSSGPTIGAQGTASSSLLLGSSSSSGLAPPLQNSASSTTTLTSTTSRFSTTLDSSSMLGSLDQHTSVGASTTASTSSGATFGVFSSAAAKSEVDDFADFMTAEATSTMIPPVLTSMESGDKGKANKVLGSFQGVNLSGSSANGAKDGTFPVFPKIKMPFDNDEGKGKATGSSPGPITLAAAKIEPMTTIMTTTATTTSTETTSTLATLITSQEIPQGTGDIYDFLRDLDTASSSAGIFVLPEKDEASRKKDDSFGTFEAFQSADGAEDTDEFGAFSDFKSSTSTAPVEAKPKPHDMPSGFTSTHSSSHQFADFETAQSTSLGELNKFELHPSAHGDVIPSSEDFKDFSNFEPAAPEPSKSAMDDFGEFSNFQASMTPPSENGFHIPHPEKLNASKQAGNEFGNLLADSVSETMGLASSIELKTSESIGGALLAPSSIGGDILAPSGGGGLGTLVGNEHDAEHNLINAVPLDSTQRYKVLSSETEDVDKHAHMWGRCLNSCLLTLATGALAVQRMQDPTIRQEILQSKQGIDYFTAIAEVYTVTQRIKESVHKAARNNMKLQDILLEVDQAWKSIANFLSGSSIDTRVADFTSHHVAADEDKRLACGLCLLNTSKKSEGSGTSKVADTVLNYGARQYHATCANLWCNRVDSILPSLFPVYSLI